MNKINVIEKSRGRFFGLNTTQGQTMNARFVDSSEKYIRVVNKKTKKMVKLAKSSVSSVSYGGKIFSK